MTDAAPPYGRKTQSAPAVPEIHILWITAALGYDGNTLAITAATRSRWKKLCSVRSPGLPRARLHNPLLAYENRDEFLKPFRDAAAGRPEPFLLVVEGSIPNERNKAEGYWAALGTDPVTGQPIPTCDWIDRLAPKAWTVLAAGTCAAYGGIHAMEGTPTGAMGLTDYLGRDFRSRAGIPIVNVPGCPVLPDNFMEVLLYLLTQAARRAPMIPPDEQGRPTWLLARTLHEECTRAGYYEQADFAAEHGQPECIVALGCWGPVVRCNVGVRGWVNGAGGCPGAGGVCIGCTMPGFPDKFMPFMDVPPGARLSRQAVRLYGRVVRALRGFTQESMNREPPWRHR